MQGTIDAFWRAAIYCFHPRVVWLSLMPLALAVALALGLGYFFWAPAVSGVLGVLEHWSLGQAMLGWLDSLGASSFRAVLGPLVVVALALPVIVVLSLLLVAAFMTPALVDLVARLRFPALARAHAASAWASLRWSLGASVVALVVMIASIPLWLIPPLGVVLPPLIWGWLTYRVLSFDTLASHATPAERQALLRLHRTPLLAMGVACGLLGGAPTALWALGAFALALAPLLIVASIWLYTLVFAFSSLWFAHYLLARLAQLRQGGDRSPTSLVSTDFS